MRYLFEKLNISSLVLFLHIAEVVQGQMDKRTDIFDLILLFLKERQVNFNEQLY